jgi:hypothetical protein
VPVGKHLWPQTAGRFVGYEIRIMAGKNWKKIDSWWYIKSFGRCKGPKLLFFK